MAKQRIAVTWQMCGFIEVEAESLQDAMKKVKENPDDFTLPKDGGDYVDGSFDLTTDDAAIMTLICNPKVAHRNDYSLKIEQKFWEKCQGYGLMYPENGTLEFAEKVENVVELAAWYLITYDRYACETLEEQQKCAEAKSTDSVFLCTNGTAISFAELKAELEKCFVFEDAEKV